MIPEAYSIKFNMDGDFLLDSLSFKCARTFDLKIFTSDSGKQCSDINNNNYRDTNNQ